MTDQPETYCCDRMRRDLTWICEQHSRAECPDTFFDYNARFDEYALLMLDNMAVITINFCPFCGQKFPESARDRWFDEVEAMGLDPFEDRDKIPAAFHSDAWRKAPKTG